jgi:DNA polymerase-3 subunit delta
MENVTNILEDIKRGTLKPIYAFDGEEPYYIDVLVDAFEQQVLQPHEKDFNLTILYGKDSTWTDVVNACRSYPAFAERRVVILKEASQLKNFTELERYTQQPSLTTILVIAHKYKKIDGRSSVLKSIKKHGVHINFEKLREDKLPTWILNYCQTHQLKINASNAALLATYLGNDLQKIVNELEKVVINITAGQEITADLIEQYIGISKEYNVFEYPKMMMQRDVEKSFRIVNYYIANPKNNPLVVIAAMLYAEFKKLYAFHYAKNMSDKDIASLLKIAPFFISSYRQYANTYSLQQTVQAIFIIQEFNLKSIGIGSANNSHTLLKELTSKILSL